MHQEFYKESFSKTWAFLIFIGNWVVVTSIVGVLLGCWGFLKNIKHQRLKLSHGQGNSLTFTPHLGVQSTDVQRETHLANNSGL